MDGCAIPAGPDLDEVIVSGSITRMLSDNYTLLVIFAVTSIILGVIFFYFLKQILVAINAYNKNLKTQGLSSKSATQNDDVPAPTDADDDETTKEDPSKYEDPNKRKFYKILGDIYKEYNTEMSNYVKSTYNRANDDYMDKNVAYKRYDNYKYTSPTDDK